MNLIIRTAKKYYQGGQTKEDQQGRAWSPKRKWEGNAKNYFEEI